MHLYRLLLACTKERYLGSANIKLFQGKYTLCKKYNADNNNINDNHLFTLVWLYTLLLALRPKTFEGRVEAALTLQRNHDY